MPTLDHTRTIDLNCDLGEGSPHDATLIPLATSANIACAAHAGDEATLRHAIDLALAARINIGAHPGHPDPANFGRLELPLPPGRTRQLLTDQLTLFLHHLSRAGGQLSHVKPHGALYHQASRDPAIAAELVATVRALSPRAAIVCPPGSQLALAATNLGIPVVLEAFIDRAYTSTGNLVPRNHPNALLPHDLAIAQALSLALHHRVTSLDGTQLHLHAQTLCVHGDGPGAARLLAEVRATLTRAGVELLPFVVK
jgi:5-oxoprolinase (ATP-hydrolysing) subunit A